VNPTLHKLEAAVRLLLSPPVEVSLQLDPAAGSVQMAPGELDLVTLNLVLDARARLGGSGRIAIRSARDADADAEAVAIAVEDLPGTVPHSRTAVEAQFGLATVRLIACDAAGQIDVRPACAGGSQVSLRLPARQDNGS